MPHQFGKSDLLLHSLYPLTRSPPEPGRWYVLGRCSAVQCSVVQCSAVRCSAVQCSAAQCSAVQCSAVSRDTRCTPGFLAGRIAGRSLHSAVQCRAVQCSAVQCSAVQGSAVQDSRPHSAQCSAVQCSAVPCSAVQCRIAGRTLHAGDRWPQRFHPHRLWVASLLLVRTAFAPIGPHIN
jgi:hypothetical protein